MPPECSRALTDSPSVLRLVRSGRPGRFQSLPTMKSWFRRFLILALATAVIVTPPIPFVAAHGPNSLHHPSSHAPRKQQRIPRVVKERTALGSFARSSSTSGPAPGARSRKRLPSPPSGCFAAGQSSAPVGSHRLFRPLRC